MKSGYVSTCGEPVVLDKEVRDTIGNVGGVGYLNINNGDNGLDVSMCVGDLYSYPNLIQTPSLDYGDILFESMEAFMDDNFFKANQLISEFLDNDNMVKYEDNYEQDYLKASEHNIEYCFLNDKENLVSNIIANNGNFNLINPSKGSVVRLVKAGYKEYIDNIYILKGADRKYVDIIKGLLAEYKLEGQYIGSDELPLDKNYYLGCYGYIGRKYGLKKYCGFDPNLYSSMCNGVVDGITYNRYCTSIRYNRTGHVRVNTNYYKEKDIYRYGCDYLLSRYDNSSYYNKTFGMCHDMVSTYQIFKGYASIVRGKILLANCYVLCGDYYHDDRNIYNKKGDIVYTAGCLNHSCRDLSSDWKILNTNGKLLSEASYLIGMFSSRCVFLGKKYRLLECPPTYSCCQIDNKYYKVTTGKYDKIVIKDDKGKIRLKYRDKEVNVTECVVFPHNNELWQYFKMADYCYGTYHTIVQELNRVSDKSTLEEIENAFTRK